MINTTTDILYKEHLDRLCENIEKDYSEWSKNLYTNQERKPEIRRGRKFDRIFRGTSIWGFVAKKDGRHKGIDFKRGDVFKAQGLRQPAKHVRGSIFDNNTDWFSWTGPEYMLTRKARLSNEDSK
mgnify:CR=1 FL=1|tara:strand:- start:140 stop:514 length:375 start_codon:yes stop_codon:yes gene_type:complete